VIIDNLYVESVPVPPDKTYAVLIANRYGVLSCPIPARRLQSVTGRYS